MRSSSASWALAVASTRFAWLARASADSMASRESGSELVLVASALVSVFLARSRSNSAGWSNGDDRAAQDGFEAVDGVAALLLPEALHGVVDHDMLREPGGPLEWPLP